MAEFEKKKLELQRDAELNKWMRGPHRLVARALPRGEGRQADPLNRDVLRYEDSTEPPPYEPCMPRRMFGGYPDGDGPSPLTGAAAGPIAPTHRPPWLLSSRRSP